MADELIPVGQSGNKKRLKDMGDSSFAEVVSALVTGPTRDAGVLHRSAIAAVDKLATPGTPVPVDQANTGGTHTHGAIYNIAVSAGNRYGDTAASAIGAVTLGSGGGSVDTHVIRVPITQVVGAEWYDIFDSTDAAPKWVGRITEAQRATGIVLSDIGTTSAGSVAGDVDINKPGTQVASNAAPYVINNAYTPALVTAVNCAGRRNAHLHVKLAVTDLRSLPTLKLVPMLVDELSADYHAAGLITMDLLNGPGQPLLQVFDLPVNGSTGLVVLVDTISGNGAAVSVWVELD